MKRTTNSRKRCEGAGEPRLKGAAKVDPAPERYFHKQRGWRYFKRERSDRQRRAERAIKINQLLEKQQQRL